MHPMRTASRPSVSCSERLPRQKDQGTNTSPSPQYNTSRPRPTSQRPASKSTTLTSGHVRPLHMQQPAAAATQIGHTEILGTVTVDVATTEDVGLMVEGIVEAAAKVLVERAGGVVIVIGTDETIADEMRGAVTDTSAPSSRMCSREKMMTWAGSGRIWWLASARIERMKRGCDERRNVSSGGGR